MKKIESAIWQLEIIRENVIAKHRVSAASLKISKMANGENGVWLKAWRKAKENNRLAIWPSAENKEENNGENIEKRRNNEMSMAKKMAW